MEQVIKILKEEIGTEETPTNLTRYAAQEDSMNFFHTHINGYPWCAVFLIWAFHKAYGVERGSQICFADKYSCSCSMWLTNFRKKDRFYTPDKGAVGDIAFFKQGHVGYVVDYSQKTHYFKTIEGNYRNKVGIALHNSDNVLGFGRPDYSLVDERGEAKKWATENNIIIGSDKGFEWDRPITREEFAIALKRYHDYM